MGGGGCGVWPLLVCFCFDVWRERNRRIFDGIEPKNLTLKELFIRSPINWFVILLERDGSSLLDFIDDLNCR